jgi:hypothetical protein
LSGSGFFVEVIIHAIELKAAAGAGGRRWPAIDGSEVANVSLREAIVMTV